MMGESRYPPNPAHGDRIHQYSEVSFENTSSRGLNSQPNSTNIFKSIFSRLREQYERVVPKISRWKSQSLASLGHSRSTSTLGRNNHSTANTIEMKARHNRVSSLRPLPNRPNGELKLRAHLRKPSGPRHLPHLATIDAKAVVAIQQLQPISEEELFEISENSNLLEIIKRMKFNLVQLENHAISGKDKDLENHSLEISLIIEFIRIGYEELKVFFINNKGLEQPQGSS